MNKKVWYFFWIAGLFAVLLLLGLQTAGDRVVISESREKSDQVSLDNGRYIFGEEKRLSRLERRVFRHIIEVDVAGGQIVSSEQYNTDEPFQIFYITRRNSGYYSIVSVASWKYLAVGENLLLQQTEEYRGDEQQQWAFVYTGDNKYRILNRKGGYLHYENGVFTADNKEEGEWIIRKVPEPE